MIKINYLNEIEFVMRKTFGKDIIIYSTKTKFENYISDMKPGETRYFILEEDTCLIYNKYITDNKLKDFNIEFIVLDGHCRIIEFVNDKVKSYIGDSCGIFFAKHQKVEKLYKSFEEKIGNPNRLSIVLDTRNNMDDHITFALINNTFNMYVDRVTETERILQLPSFPNDSIGHGTISVKYIALVPLEYQAFSSINIPSISILSKGFVNIIVVGY